MRYYSYFIRNSLDYAIHVRVSVSRAPCGLEEAASTRVASQVAARSAAVRGVHMLNVAPRAEQTTRRTSAWRCVEVRD